MKKTVSLTENHLFRRLYRWGKSVVTPYAVVYYKKNQLPYNRVGITATKKIGNAVQRNRARRLLREAYRSVEPMVPDHLDIVLVARKKTVFAKMQQVENCLKKALVSKSEDAHEK